MKITHERLIEILKCNCYISDILHYPSLDVKFSVIEEIDEDVFDIGMLVSLNDGEYISDINFRVNTKNYDEALNDIEKYEVDDMELQIEIYLPDTDFDFSLETIWKILFFNKERMK
jgi:hypothetical protein